MHTYVSDERLAMDLVGAVVASPLRDPSEVWKSWVRRMGTGHEVPLKHFDASWKRLAHLDDIYDITYVPLDRPERDAQFERLQLLLGERIEPNWEVRNGHIPQEDMEICVGYRGGEVEKDLSWIYELPMVKKYYERA